MKKWLHAARLRTLPLSISGVLLGSFIAYSEDYWNSLVFILAILTTLLFQVLSNFANDYGDGVKGTDDQRLGEKRLVASGAITPNQMKRAVIIFSLLSAISAISLIILAFGFKNLGLILTFLFLGAFAIWAAIKYTVGSGAYGYRGLGDLFVFLFFGWVGVYGSYTLFQHTSFNPLVLLPASAIGLLSSAVLNLNNLRDRETDLQSNKITLALRLGKYAKLYQAVLMLLPWFLGLAYLLLTDNESLKIFLFGLLLLPLLFLFAKINSTKENAQLDKYLKFQALYTLLFAIVLSILVN